MGTDAKLHGESNVNYSSNEIDKTIFILSMVLGYHCKSSLIKISNLNY